MAILGRGNGLMEEDDNEDKNALFEEEGLEELDAHTPPHLRTIVDASQRGDLDALRLALGYTEVVQLLINSANDAERVKRMLETVDAEGDTPLHHAARGEHADIIRLLLASGALPAMANEYGKIPSDLPEADTPLLVWRASRLYCRNFFSRIPRFFAFVDHQLRVIRTQFRNLVVQQRASCTISPDSSAKYMCKAVVSVNARNTKEDP